MVGPRESELEVRLVLMGPGRSLILSLDCFYPRRCRILHPLPTSSELLPPPPLFQVRSLHSPSLHLPTSQEPTPCWL